MMFLYIIFYSWTINRYTNSSNFFSRLLSNHIINIVSSYI
nr:MAG TPA: hypothetical protein [Bacteriophage sp.]